MSLLLTQLFHTRLNWLRSRPKMSHADVESTEFRLLARCLEGIPEQAKHRMHEHPLQLQPRGANLKTK